MKSNEAILIVLIILLVIVVLGQGRGGGSKNRFATKGETPYTALDRQAGAITGVRNDGYNQEHPYVRADLAKNYRSWAAKPHDIAEAQRAAWYEATRPGSNSNAYDPTIAWDAGKDMANYHAPGPSINYQDALIDLVADERTRRNHEQWVSEVAPFSQTSMKVDDMDEAVAMAQPRVGLSSFRFHGGPTQNNPLFVTELDAEQLASQGKRFDFNG